VLSDTFITMPSGDAYIHAWAFAYWGGDFYFFTSSNAEPAGVSLISRYHPGDPPVAKLLTTFGGTIVGAGVSTCAPVP
jgi:hypothetical protein